MVSKRPKGQMILIMAVTFAVTVLATVILLNTLHASADVNTQAQASSLDDIERTQTQVAADMERLFLVHTSMNRTGEALPYADNSGPDDRFDNVVRNYSDLNAAVTGAESGAVVTVTYADRSQEGLLVHQNDSTRNFTNQGDASDVTVLSDAEGLPRFSMNVTSYDSNNGTFRVVVDGDNRLTISGDGVESSGVVCEPPYPIQVEATAGVGIVSNQSEVCGTFDLEPPEESSFDVEFENGDAVTGNFTISGANPTGSAFESNTEDWQQVYGDDDEVIVNPAFRMEYTDSSITHTANFSLYNETSP